jgi:hypothetical protein
MDWQEVVGRKAILVAGAQERVRMGVQEFMIKAEVTMIKAEDLFIGAWVSVGEKPVEVRMVSRRKIGYHRDGDKTRLVYARLADVEPLMVEQVEFGIDEWIVNGVVRIKTGKIWRWGVEAGVRSGVRIENVYEECFIVDTFCGVHELQRILKIMSRL